MLSNSLMKALSAVVSEGGRVTMSGERRQLHHVDKNAENSKLYFPTERSSIMSCTEDFGRYTHEVRRAVRLLASLE
jgi:hypothetical protein